jgi:hypothetical protein
VAAIAAVLLVRAVPQQHNARSRAVGAALLSGRLPAARLLPLLPLREPQRPPRAGGQPQGCPNVEVHDRTRRLQQAQEVLTEAVHLLQCGIHLRTTPPRGDHVG